jgi:hemerythrin-like domain-containing protein
MTTSDVGDNAEKTRPLLAEHERLLDHVEHIRVAAIELPSLSEEERHELIERIVSFLRDDLATHAESEERGLYPHVARLLGPADGLRP